MRSEQENRKTLENIEKINIFKGFVFGGDGALHVKSTTTNDRWYIMKELIKAIRSAANMNQEQFASALGTTPHKFNENIIIDHAVELLDNSDLSIK